MEDALLSRLDELADDFLGSAYVSLTPAEFERLCLSFTVLRDEIGAGLTEAKEALKGQRDCLEKERAVAVGKLQFQVAGLRAQLDSSRSAARQQQVQHTLQLAAAWRRVAELGGNPEEAAMEKKKLVAAKAATEQAERKAEALRAGLKLEIESLNENIEELTAQLSAKEDKLRVTEEYATVMRRDLTAAQRTCRDREKESTDLKEKLTKTKEELGAVRSLRDRLDLRLGDTQRELIPRGGAPGQVAGGAVWPWADDSDGHGLAARPAGCGGRRHRRPRPPGRTATENRSARQPGHGDSAALSFYQDVQQYSILYTGCYYSTRYQLARTRHIYICMPSVVTHASGKT